MFFRRCSKREITLIHLYKTIKQYGNHLGFYQGALFSLIHISFLRNLMQFPEGDMW